MSYVFKIRTYSAHEDVERIRRALNKEFQKMLGTKTPLSPPGDLYPSAYSQVAVQDGNAIITADGADQKDCPNCKLGHCDLPTPKQSDVDFIRQHIARASKRVHLFLQSNYPLKRHHEETLWYGEYYVTRKQEKNEPSEAVATALEHRIRSLSRTAARAATEDHQIAAAVILRLLPKPAFDVGDHEFLAEVAADLTAAVHDKSNDVRYESSVALASMAKHFYEYEGLIDGAANTLVDAMEILRYDSHYNKAHILEMIRNLDLLLDHKDELSPLLEPSSISVRRSGEMFKVLSMDGANSEVRKAASNASVALQRRLKNFSESSGSSGTPTSPPSGGSPKTGRGLSGQGLRARSWRRGPNRFGQRFPGLPISGSMQFRRLSR